MLLLLQVVALGTACSADSQADAWQALGKLRAKDYFLNEKQLKLAKAIESDDTRALVEVLKEGVDINGAGKEEMRPLFWAMAKRSLKAFEFLLQNGADPNISAKNPVEGRRPLSIMELAAIAENPEYLRLALEHHGNANFSVVYGHRTIIYEAILNERLNNIRLLIENGADLSIQDTAGESPIMIAASVNTYNIVYLLLEKGANPSQKNRWGFDLVGRMKKYGTQGIAPDSDQYRWFLKVSEELEKRGFSINAKSIPSV